jgi:hypothetical protein
MGFEKYQHFNLGMIITKRLGREGDPDPLGVNGIYQRRHTKNGVLSIKMKFYTPTNPNSPEQVANRSKFQSAMFAWNALTPEQRIPYTKKAKKLMLRPHNVFVREYYQLNP